MLLKIRTVKGYLRSIDCNEYIDTDRSRQDESHFVGLTPLRI